MKIFFIVLFVSLACLQTKAAGLPEETGAALRKYSIYFDSVVNNYYAGGFVGNGFVRGNGL